MNDDSVSAWVVGLGLVALLVYSAQQNDTSERGAASSYASSSGLTSISRYEAVNQHWDEIKNYVSGSGTVEACSESGCYELDVEMSYGTIEYLHFPNGGYQSLSADIDQHGNASDVDQRGRYWDITLDMESSIVDDAVREWAEVNDRVIE